MDAWVGEIPSKVFGYKQPEAVSIGSGADRDFSTELYLI